jgi:hypothetical protein
MGPGSCVTALIAAGILSSNGSSISTKGNSVQDPAGPRWTFVEKRHHVAFGEADGDRVPPVLREPARLTITTGDCVRHYSPCHFNPHA